MIRILWSILALLTLTTPAFATHKAWLLKQPGGDCAFEAPRWTGGFGDGGTIQLVNRTSDNRTAVCPVTVAGRWGSSGTVAHGVMRWAEAKYAFVNVYNGEAATPVSCTAVARLRFGAAAGGALQYGTTRSVSGMGFHQIQLIANQQDWGGGLETNEGLQLRSLDFRCTLPKAGLLGWSHIHGYGVALCSRAAGCYDLDPDDSNQNEVPIQVNGANCTSRDPGVWRGADGLTATINGVTTINCPIQSPSQDSYHSFAGLRRVRAYLSGFTGSSTCVQNGTCPVCTVEWVKRNDPLVVRSSLPFTWNSAGYMEMPLTPDGENDPTNMGIESGMAVRCLLKPNWRMRGITASAKQTRVSDGV